MKLRSETRSRGPSHPSPSPQFTFVPFTSTIHVKPSIILARLISLPHGPSQHRSRSLPSRAIKSIILHFFHKAYVVEPPRAHALPFIHSFILLVDESNHASNVRWPAPRGASQPRPGETPNSLGRCHGSVAHAASGILVKFSSRRGASKPGVRAWETHNGEKESHGWDWRANRQFAGF
jgi:hypothetical protein